MTVAVIGNGGYAGTASIDYAITKAANMLKVKVKAAGNANCKASACKTVKVKVKVK